MAQVSDDFNRANSSSLGANWSDVRQAGNTIGINSNYAYEITSVSDWAIYAYTGTFPADQTSQVTITGSAVATGYGYGVGVRYTYTSNSNGYLTFLFNGTAYLYAQVAGVFNLLTSVSQAFAVGDQLRLQVITTGGNARLIVFYNNASIIDYTDSTYASTITGGNPAIALFGGDSAHGVDDFVGTYSATIVGSLSDGVTTGDTESSKAVLGGALSDGVTTGDVESGVITGAGAQVSGSTTDGVTMGDSESATITSGAAIQPQPPVAGWARYERVRRERLPQEPEQKLSRSVVLSAVAPLRAKLILRRVKARGGRGITAYANALRLYSQLHPMASEAASEVVHLSPLQMQLLLGHETTVTADAQALPVPLSALGEVGTPQIKAVRNPTDEELIHLIEKML